MAALSSSRINESWKDGTTVYRSIRTLLKAGFRLPPSRRDSNNRMNLVCAVDQRRRTHEERQAGSLRRAGQVIPDSFRTERVQVATMNSLMVPAAAVHHSRFVALLVSLPRDRDD